MEKKLFHIFCIIGTVLLVLSVATIVIFTLTIMHEMDHEYQYPDSGIWYCKELQIQLSFDDGYDSYYKEGDVISNCTWQVDYGTNTIRIHPQMDSSEYYNIGKTLFSGIYVKGDADSFVIRERDGTSEYTFFRQSENVIGDS